MNKKELMLLEIARLYKGITVLEYQRMFAGMTANELEGYLHKAKQLAVTKGTKI
jgi:hypothetical protein